MINNNNAHSLNSLLLFLADKYETADFLVDDPSYFIHKVKGIENQEVLAFIASCLSYGSRKQFFPKIQRILDFSGGNVYLWVKSEAFKGYIPDNTACYYRLYTNHIMRHFLMALSLLLQKYSTISHFLQVVLSYDGHKKIDAFSCICAITEYFSEQGIETIIPKNTISSCKRICMFLRWMVREKSPVDLGIWSYFVDKKTLIIPLDTHVLQEAMRLGLINNKNASMKSAKMLTLRMKEVFSEDPLKGDFALFGLGIDTNNKYLVSCTI